MSSCLYQVINVLLFIPDHRRLLFIPGHQRPFVYTRSSSDFLFIPGEASYSHQWPGCGGRFLGRYNSDERFLGRLCEWRLGERDPRLWDGSERRVVSSCPVSGMSKTVGGRSARLMAAASGGAASKSSRVSGQAASGWGSTRPGLKPPAILSSLCGSVNDLFPLKCTQRAIQRRSLDEIYWCNLAGCLAGPVYIHPGIQSGPGQIGVLNYDWSIFWGTVSAVGARRSGDAPLEYSSLTR